MVKSIIKESMDDYGVRARLVPYEYQPFRSPQHAQDSKRYIEVKGFAWFSCPQRHNRWSSPHAWCFIDLKKQTICFTYKQFCNKCESKARPRFTEESIERMADYVVKKYIRKIRVRRLLPTAGSRSYDNDSDYGDDSDCSSARISRGRHDQERCGKCRELGYRCCM